MRLPIIFLKFCVVALIGILVPSNLKADCTIQGDLQVCRSSYATYEVSTEASGGTITYLWYLDGGGSIADPTDPEISVFWAHDGSFNLHCEIYVNNVLYEDCMVTVQVESLSGEIYFIDPGNNLGIGGEFVRYVYCVGDEIKLGISNQSDGLEFVWDLDGVNVTSIVEEDGIEISFIEAGILEVCAILTNGADCGESRCLTIEVIDLNAGLSFEAFPNNVVSGTLSICTGQEYLFLNTSPELPVGFIWTVTHGTTSWTYRSTDLSFLFNDPGSYLVTLSRYVEEAGCPIDEVTLTVVVQDNPITPILCPKAVCTGDEVCYTAEFQCGTYQWSVSAEGTIQGSSTSQEVCVVWHNNPGSLQGAISLTVTSCTEDYCTNPTTAYVPLFPPDLPIEGKDVICGNDGHIYEAPAWNGMMYDWSIELIPPYTGNVSFTDGSYNTFVTFSDNFAGTFILSVKATQNVGDCVYEAEKEVTVYNTQIKQIDNLCSGVGFTLELEPATSDPIDWVIEDLHHNVVFQSLMASSSINVPGLPGGTYTAIAMMPGGFPGGCMVQRIFYVNAEVLPPVITGPTKVCLNETVTYSSNITTNSSSNTEWVATGGIFMGPNTGQTVLVKWDALSGPYMIRARAKRGSCYSGYAGKEVMVANPNDLLITGNGTPCPDNLEPEPYCIAFGGTSIVWSILSPYTHLGSIVEGQGTSMIKINWHHVDQPTTIQLRVTGLICGVQVSEIKEITITPFTPVIEWPDPACANTEVNIEGIDADPKWFINGIFFSDDVDFIHTFQQAGEYEITLVVTNPNNCGGTFSLTETIEILPSPPAAIFQSAPLPCPDTQPFSVTLSTYSIPGANYQWTFNSNVVGTTSAITVSQTGVYDLRVIVGQCTTRVSYFLTHGCDGDCTCSQNVDVSIDAVTVSMVNCGNVQVTGDIDPFTDPHITDRDWYYPDPNNPGNTANTNITSEPVELELNYNEPGIYPIRLEVEWTCDNNEKCPKSAVAFATVPVIPDFVWEFECVNGGTQYEITLYDVSRAIVPLSPNSWTIDNAPQNSSPFIQFTRAAGAQATVCLTQSTTTNYDCEKCSTITFPGLPQGDFSIEEDAYCVNSVLTFIPDISDPNEITGIEWDFGDMSTSHLLQPTKVYAATGTYDVTMTYHTIHGCTVVESKEVQVIANTLTGNMHRTYGPCQAYATVGFLTSGSPIDYQWSTGPQDDGEPIIVVEQSGMYGVTVTGENGCTFVPSMITVTLNPPFPSGIIGELESCTNISLRVIAVSGYTFNWDITGPSGFHETKTNSLFYNRFGLSAGTYTVKVKPDDGSGNCEEKVVQVIVHGLLTPPVLTKTVLSCHPLLVRLTSNVLASWTGGDIPFFDPIEAISIEVTRPGTYRATVRNAFGCSASSTINIAAIDFSALSNACGTVCLQDIQEGFSISGIPGTMFTYWEWRLDGVAIPDESGSGSVGDLDIIEDYLGKLITLYVTLDGCSLESPPVLIEGEECVECPEEFVLNWFGPMDLIQCFQGPQQQQILHAEFVLHIPDGYVYCDSEPIFEDGTFDFDVLDYDPITNTLSIEGDYNLTDVGGFNEDYVIRGTVSLCLESNLDIKCPATFEVAEIDCSSDCAADPCGGIPDCQGSVVFVQNTPKGKQYEICMFIPEPIGLCDYDDYWIEVSVNGVYLTTIDVTSAGIDQNGEFCFYVVYAGLNAYPCFFIDLFDVCGSGCDGTFCVPNNPFHGGGTETRSVDVTTNNFTIVPNPATEESVKILSANLTVERIKVSLFDTNGKSIIHSKGVELLEGKGSLHLDKTPGGYYILRIESEGRPADYYPIIIMN